MKPLTRRQREVFEKIYYHIMIVGYSPTLKEIAEKSDFGISTAQFFVDTLIKKGWLLRKGKQLDIKKHIKSKVGDNSQFVGIVSPQLNKSIELMMNAKWKKPNE